MCESRHGASTASEIGWPRVLSITEGRIEGALLMVVDDLRGAAVNLWRIAPVLRAASVGELRAMGDAATPVLRLETTDPDTGPVRIGTVWQDTAGRPRLVRVRQI